MHNPERNPRLEARSDALLALLVMMVGKFTVFILFLVARSSITQPVWALNLHTVLFYWIIPIALVYGLERRGAGALGLVVPGDRFKRYAGYATLSLILPWIILGGGLSLIAEIMEQVFFIAVPEELLWRGYLQSRMTKWLGRIQGLIVTAILFGAGHLVAILGAVGSLSFPRDTLLVIQTTVGGLILGIMFLRAKNIVPGSLFHIFGNVFLFKLVERFI